MMFLGRFVATNSPPRRETNMKKSCQSNIYKLRTEKGLTQEELANSLHIGRDSIVQWETGKRLPAIDKAIILADSFDVSVDYILNRTACRSVENDYIQKQLGLSDKAINALKRFHRSDSAAKKELMDTLKQGQQPTKHPIYFLPIINFILSSKHFEKFVERFRNLTNDTYQVPIIHDGKKFKVMPSYISDSADFLYFGCNPDNPADNIPMKIDSDFRREISSKLLQNSLADIAGDYEKALARQQEIIMEQFKNL